MDGFWKKYHVELITVILGFLLAGQTWCKKALIVWIVCALLITAVIIYLTFYPGPGYIFLDNEGLS